MFARFAPIATFVLMLPACGSDKSSTDGANACRDLDNGIPLCGPSSVEIPLEPGSSSPVITARINGQMARVLIDTGAQDPIISSTFLGVADAAWIRTQELCFGELCLHGEQVYAEDTQFSQPDQTAINGFIGMRTLRHFIVEFDHDQSVRFTQGSSGCTGSDAPLSFGPEGTPFVDVSIDGHEFPSVTVDSGSSYTVLSQASVDLLDPYVTSQSQIADLCTIDGCMTGVAHTSTVNEYCVFGSCEASVPVKYPPFDAVGSSFLFLRHTGFDFPGSRIVFCD